MNMADEGGVFEVFQQDTKDPTPHHGGNLRAPDTELALHYAKEFYGRRQESQRLWIVPRSAFMEISDLAHPAESLHALKHEHLTESDSPKAYALFGQKQAGKALVWIQDLQPLGTSDAIKEGSQVAQSSEVEYLRLWLCPRDAVVELADPNLLQPPLDRSYRRLDGYNIREKLRIARQRVQAQGDQKHG